MCNFAHNLRLLGQMVMKVEETGWVYIRGMDDRWMDGWMEGLSEYLKQESDVTAAVIDTRAANRC